MTVYLSLSLSKTRAPLHCLFLLTCVPSYVTQFLSSVGSAMYIHLSQRHIKVGKMLEYIQFIYFVLGKAILMIVTGTGFRIN